MVGRSKYSLNVYGMRAGSCKNKISIGPAQSITWLQVALLRNIKTAFKKHHIKTRGGWTGKQGRGVLTWEPQEYLHVNTRHMQPILVQQRKNMKLSMHVMVKVVISSKPAFSNLPIKVLFLPFTKSCHVMCSTSIIRERWNVWQGSCPVHCWQTK